MSTDFLLDEDERAFKKEVREFLSAELSPLAEKIEAEGDWPSMKAGVAKLGAKGLLKDGLKPDGLVRQAIVHECASYINYAFETTIASSLSCALPLERYGADAMKARYYDDLVDGRAIGAIAITEPNVGSDASGMETEIAIDEDAGTCVINGFKRYISNAGVADLYIIYGITDRDVPPQKGMSAVIVPAGTDGLAVPRAYSFMGRNGSVVGELALENVTVPLGNMLGPVDGGFKVMLGMFNFERILLGASGLGLARRAFAAAKTHAENRVSFGGLLGEKQLIWNMIAEMRCRIDAAELVTYRAARRYDSGVSGKDLMQDASMAKLLSTRAAVYCTDKAVQILGGDGLTKEYGVVEQLYRDARAMPIAGGTNEMMAYLVARGDLPGLALDL